MRTFVGFFVVAALLFCGCREGWEADYSQLELVEVSGKVTMDGAPLSDVTIIFECADKTYSYGRTDSAGSYQLMFNSEKSGALPGPKTIRIKAGPVGEVSDTEITENADGTMSKPKPSTIPACYGAKSDLRAEIQEGKSQTVNFDLKSDCSVKGPTR